MNSFENYSNTIYALSFDEMVYCHEQLLSEIQDEDAKELYEDLIECATKYAAFRANWALWNREKKMEQDESRTMCHNALISRFDILARYLRSIGCEAEWRDTLGDVAVDPVYRKRIGDFACYMVFVNSVCER